MVGSRLECSNLGAWSIEGSNGREEEEEEKC